MRSILSWSLWPLGVGSFLASIVYFADPNTPQSLMTVAGRTTLVALVILLAIEFVLPYRADWRLRGDRDVWRDIGHFILYGPIGGTVAQVTFLVGLASLVAPLPRPALWPTSSPFVVQVLLVMVLGDGLEYWLHRLSHKVPALWSVHAIHHMPVRLHMLKAGRHHVFYFFLRGLIVWTPLLLIGVPPELIVWQFVAVTLAGNIAHANIDFRIPVFMHRVLVTPHFHRLHHSSDPGEGNSNYGVMLPVWDMIFSTHTDPVKTEARVMGIEDDPIPHRWLPELLSPFVVKRWKPLKVPESRSPSS